jgi:hypothetical protein
MYLLTQKLEEMCSSETSVNYMYHQVTLDFLIGCINEVGCTVLSSVGERWQHSVINGMYRSASPV